MIRGVGKFAAISIGGLLLLLVLGMIASVIFELNPSQVSGSEVATSWLWFRIALYLLLILLWIPACKYITRARHSERDLSEDVKKQLSDKRSKDIRYLKSQWWKIALFMIFGSFLSVDRCFNM